MASQLSQWIQATYWLWPVLEIIHFFGLTLLMGGLIIVDLRMIGFFPTISLQEVKKLLPFVIFGFLLNLITGILFVYGDPSRYAINIGFQIKLILILLAGCNAAIYHFRVETHWGKVLSTTTFSSLFSLKFSFGIVTKNTHNYRSLFILSIKE